MRYSHQRELILREGTFAQRLSNRGADLYVSAGSVPAAEPWHRLPRPEYVG